MKFISILFLIGTILLPFSRVLQAQDRRPYEESFRLPIETLVKAQYGNDYGVGIEVIDSVLGTSTCDDCDEITDPYGTLYGCVLFSATRTFTDEDSSFFGIYKNGQIVWKSDPIIKGSMAGTFATADINHDGEVDILALWYTNGDLRVYNMWIFSWNGKRCKIINAHDNWGISLIKGSDFELLNTKKKGVKKIKGLFTLQDSDDTFYYKWNGKLYVPSR